MPSMLTWPRNFHGRAVRLLRIRSDVARAALNNSIRGLCHARARCDSRRRDLAPIAGAALSKFQQRTSSSVVKPHCAVTSWP
jgi:hypothetical protein